MRPVFGPKNLLNCPKDFEGDTPLIIAVKSGVVEAVSLLLRCNETNVDAENELGQSALDIAKAEDSVIADIVKTLETRDELISEHGETC